MPESPETPEPESASRGSSHARPKRRRRRRWWIWVSAAVLAAVVIAAAVRVFAVDIYTVHQDSMDPTVEDQQRVLVDKRYPGDEAAASGAVVVFDGEGSFTPYRGSDPFARAVDQIGHWFGLGSPREVFIKRIIGAGGDTVSCCDEQGHLRLNGEQLQEGYLPYQISAEQPASQMEFEATVPEGRMWVMGDNRSDSVDSRNLLGAPGGGMISQDRIIGRATDVVWPWPDRRSLEGDRP